MAAISTTLLTLLKPGDHLLTASCLYGGTQSLIDHDLNDFGVTSSVVDAAARLDYPPLAAEALLRWGSAAMQRGDRVAGERLDLSLWTALRAEHRRVAAEAAAKRIYARLELDDRSADVGEALALAASLAERVGAGDWRSRWLLDNNAAIADERVTLELILDGVTITRALEVRRDM